MYDIMKKSERTIDNKTIEEKSEKYQETGNKSEN